MLEAGQVLHERYQLKQKLGQNAGRQTWLAEDLQAIPAKLVIVKLLAFGGEVQWDDLKLFEREAQVLQQLNHSRIPKYYDYFSIDERSLWFGLVQEFIPGASLKELLNQGKRFTEHQVRQVAIDVLNILIYLHELNPQVLHRDIKPSNLILGEDNQVYLVDFGAVQDRAVKEGATFTVVGTYGYAPMEQFGGRAVPASDLYALGATLIHLLTGTAPADLPSRDMCIQFSDKVSLNSKLVNWIQKLTEPALERRYSTARQALEALRTSSTSSFPPLVYHHPKNRIHFRKSTSQFQIEISPMRMSLQRGIEVGSGFIWLPILSSIAFTVGVFTLMLGVMPIGLMFSESFGIIPGLFMLLVGAPFAYFGGLLFLFLFKLIIQMGAVMSKALIAYFGSVSINFDRDHFEIVRRVFGISYLRQKGIISDVQPAFPENTKLTIQAGAKQYSLGEELTPNECVWLYDQIQSWLKLKHR